MQEVKAMARLCVCTGSSDPSLLADAISTKASCAGLLVNSRKYKPEHLVEIYVNIEDCTNKQIT